VHFVLNGFEKIDADIQRGVIINTGRINIGNLLIKTPLGSSNILNAPFKFFKIIKR